MAYYFGLLGIIVCIIHNQEAKLIENFQEENVIVFQLQNDGKGKWNTLVSRMTVTYTFIFFSKFSSPYSLN